MLLSHAGHLVATRTQPSTIGQYLFKGRFSELADFRSVSGRFSAFNDCDPGSGKDLRTRPGSGGEFGAQWDAALIVRDHVETWDRCLNLGTHSLGGFSWSISAYKKGKEGSHLAIPKVSFSPEFLLFSFLCCYEWKDRPFFSWAPCRRIAGATGEQLKDGSSLGDESRRSYGERTWRGQRSYGERTYALPLWSAAPAAGVAGQEAYGHPRSTRRPSLFRWLRFPRLL